MSAAGRTAAAEPAAAATLSCARSRSYGSELHATDASVRSGAAGRRDLAGIDIAPSPAYALVHALRVASTHRAPILLSALSCNQSSVVAVRMRATARRPQGQQTRPFTVEILGLPGLDDRRSLAADRPFVCYVVVPTMNDDPFAKLMSSPLSRTLTFQGVVFELEIYRGQDETDWILEVVHEDGTSTVWDERFASDQAALDEAMRELEADGPAAFAADAASHEGRNMHGEQAPRTLDEALARVHSELTPWQVHALFLGAHTSTAPGLGPQHVFQHVWGDNPVGVDLEDANANIQALVSAWNQLADANSRGDRVRLSACPLSETPSGAELEALTARRIEEIVFFTRGIDAGGDDPIEFGEQGGALFHKLGEASAFLTVYRDLLHKPGTRDSELRDAGRTLTDLTTAIESVIEDLMRVGDDVRRTALREHEKRAGQRTDDGMPVPSAAKVGRNDKCPCGSGRKWKRCCGALGRAH